MDGPIACGRWWSICAVVRGWAFCRAVRQLSCRRRLGCGIGDAEEIKRLTATLATQSAEVARRSPLNQKLVHYIRRLARGRYDRSTEKLLGDPSTDQPERRGWWLGTISQRVATQLSGTGWVIRNGTAMSFSQPPTATGRLKSSETAKSLVILRRRLWRRISRHGHPIG